MPRHPDVDAWFERYDNPMKPVMFHLGARIPGHHPRLEGTGDTSRVMKIGSVEEAESARPDVESIVRAWCDWRES